LEKIPIQKSAQRRAVLKSVHVLESRQHSTDKAFVALKKWEAGGLGQEGVSGSHVDNVPNIRYSKYLRRITWPLVQLAHLAAKQNTKSSWAGEKYGPYLDRKETDKNIRGNNLTEKGYVNNSYKSSNRHILGKNLQQCII
jgi:hypothetical protein